MNKRMNEKAPEQKLVELLQEKGFIITTVESCTGGMIAATIVNVPGASSVLNEAYITYSNEAKHRLVGVNEETLENYGAVSEETAMEMVTGVAKRTGANCAIAVTGIAGPGGGTAEKPVGTVYAGLYCNGITEVTRYNFSGDRTEIRSKTVASVLEKMIKMIKNN